MTSSARNSGPQRLGEILAGVFARMGLERDIDDYRIWQAWDEVVGPSVARNAQPVRLDAHRLVVAVKSNTWMQELSLLRRDLCSRLNEWMGREVVAEIFLVVGQIQPREEQSPPAAGSRPRALGARPGAEVVESREQTHRRLSAAIERLWQAARERSGGRGSGTPEDT